MRQQFHILPRKIIHFYAKRACLKCSYFLVGPIQENYLFPIQKNRWVQRVSQSGEVYIGFFSTCRRSEIPEYLRRNRGACSIAHLLIREIESLFRTLDWIVLFGSVLLTPSPYFVVCLWALFCYNSVSENQEPKSQLDPTARTGSILFNSESRVSSCQAETCQDQSAKEFVLQRLGSSAFITVASSRNVFVTAEFRRHFTAIMGYMHTLWRHAVFYEVSPFLVDNFLQTRDPVNCLQNATL